MKQVEAFHDPDDGELWRWQLNRDDYFKGVTHDSW